MTPEIREIQTFLLLAETGSFSATAKILNISQPAVSLQIAKMEQSVGFPLLHRNPDGAAITAQGKALIPLMEEIRNAHSNLLGRAAYWQRFQSKQVKIWIDGSINAYRIRNRCDLDEPSLTKSEWDYLGSTSDWIEALQNYEVDLVIAGSFLKSDTLHGIDQTILQEEPGITIAWNPECFSLEKDSFDLPEALALSVILPSPSLCLGFRKFLDSWCDSTYQAGLKNFIECKSELDALNACKFGLGVIVFPGDAEKRMGLSQAGLTFSKGFIAPLPKAYAQQIHYRSTEKNPKIIAAMHSLARVFEHSK